MNYFLGDVLAINPRYKVSISGHDVRGRNAFTVIGYTQNDFGVSGGNSYDGQGSLLKSGVNAVANTIDRATKTGIASGAVSAYDNVNDAITATTGADRMTTKLGSQQVWTGSRVPTFNIEMTLVCLNAVDPNQSVVKRVNDLMKAVYPTDALGGLYLAPPLGYATNVNGSLSMAGKSSLSIGTWFHASYLIIEDVNFQFSKELNKRGQPIYAAGSISLRPYRQVTYKEYTGWFK
jgi:hypothetical protein